MFSPFSVPPDASLAQRLGAVVLRVLGALGERTRRVPDGSPVHHLVPQAVYDRVHAWLRARRLAIMALMERIQAGTLRPPRPYAPRALAEGTEPRARKMPPPEERIPPVFGWVCRWAPEARFAGHDLSALLEDAEMKALVLAAPERMVRLWTPMLNALGRPKPDWFPKWPKRVRKRSLRRCREVTGRAVEAAGPRGATPPTRRDGSSFAPGLLTPPPPYVPPSPCPPPPKPVPEAAPWTGLGPGPCATLAQYRSPFQPGGDENPRMPPWPATTPERQTRPLQKIRPR
jgi:hypothetical protein